MMVPSCTFDASPTTMGAVSPRNTAWYQTLARAPRVTSPSTTAPGAMNAVGWMLMLLPHRLERPLDPRVDRLAVLLGRIPAQVLRDVHGLVVERVHVGPRIDARLDRLAVA